MLAHGGNLHDAITRFGIPAEDWLDLSTGINPRPYPVPSLTSRAWHRLPCDHAALAAAAAPDYRAPRLLPVAGTQAALQALPRVRATSRVAGAAPAEAEHAYRWKQAGHSVREVPHAKLEPALDDCDVLVVCSPNNPTGAVVEPMRLLRWADSLAARKGWLIVDEAFADTAPHASVAPMTGSPGLIVLRSVGKFFGLAGLRLGFVAAHPGLLAALEEYLGPWTVSGPAQEIGCAALCDTAWQDATRERLLGEGRRLHRLLAAHGIAASGTALFQWWREARAEAFQEHMARRAIWVRLFPQAARGIRLGLAPDEDGWRRLEQALEEWKGASV